MKKKKMKPPVLQHRRLLKMTENQDEVIFGGQLILYRQNVKISRWAVKYEKSKWLWNCNQTFRE